MYNLLNIKQVASDKGITIKELVKRIKKTEQGFYKSLEANSMNIKTLDMIAEVLGVTVSDLINDRASKPTKTGHKKSLVAQPVEIYNPPTKNEDQLRIMFEQQCEIAKLEREVKDWMEKAHSLEIELERVKNASAPVKDALAG